MSEQIKSGQDVIEEFFSEIYNIEGADEKTTNALVKLYMENKFTDTNIQNALDALKSLETKPKKQ